MKVEVTNQEKKFEPIELRITIESAKELCDLYHRFDLTASGIEKVYSDLLVYKPTECDNNVVFKKLYNIVTDKYPHLFK